MVVSRAEATCPQLKIANTEAITYTDPRGVRFDKRQEGSEALYTCKTGFRKAGNTLSRVCKSGKFTGAKQLCVGACCVWLKVYMRLFQMLLCKNCRQPRSCSSACETQKLLAFVCPCIQGATCLKPRSTPPGARLRRAVLATGFLMASAEVSRCEIFNQITFCCC